MATSWQFTEGEWNYYRICYIATEVLTEALRTIFKQEWDSRYKAILGEWKDDPKNGWDFWNGESLRNRRRYARQLITIRNGDRAEWDCAMLFYAILHSHPIYDLNPTVQSSVDYLRKFLNEEFVHMPRGHLSSVDFQSAILKVSTAFHALSHMYISFHPELILSRFSNFTASSYLLLQFFYHPTSNAIFLILLQCFLHLHQHFPGHNHQFIYFIMI